MVDGYSHLVICSIRDVGADLLDHVFDYLAWDQVCHVYRSISTHDGRVANEICHSEGGSASLFLGVMCQAERAAFSCEASSGVGYSVPSSSKFYSNQEVAIFASFSSFS